VGRPAASAARLLRQPYSEVGSAPKSNLATAPVGTVTTLSLPATGISRARLLPREGAERQCSARRQTRSPSRSLERRWNAGDLLVTVAAGKTTMRWTAPATGGSVSAHVRLPGSGAEKPGVSVLPASPTVLVGASPGAHYRSSAHARSAVRRTKSGCRAVGAKRSKRRRKRHRTSLAQPLIALSRRAAWTPLLSTAARPDWSTRFEPSAPPDTAAARAHERRRFPAQDPTCESGGSLPTAAQSVRSPPISTLT
jgi:hypothetical protein